LIDKKDKGGFTALMIAAYYCKKEIAEILVSHGADITARYNEDEDKTAFDYAKNWNEFAGSDVLESLRI
jgi:ankyrin repeat protein